MLTTPENWCSSYNPRLLAGDAHIPVDRADKHALRRSHVAWRMPSGIRRGSGLFRMRPPFGFGGDEDGGVGRDFDSAERFLRRPGACPLPISHSVVATLAPANINGVPNSFFLPSPHHLLFPVVHAFVVLCALTQIELSANLNRLQVFQVSCWTRDDSVIRFAGPRKLDLPVVRQLGLAHMVLPRRPARGRRPHLAATRRHALADHKAKASSPSSSRASCA